MRVRHAFVAGALTLACSYKAGEAGAPSLSLSSDYQGPNCPAGGVAIHTGVDVNRNAVLDDNEVAQVSYLCAGSPDSPTQVLAKLKEVDGSGSGLDADALGGWSLQQLIATLQPAGTVIAFAGDAAPVGWLVCDGSEVRRDAYPALFQAIGVRHGQGNGTTTFNLPDYRGRFLRGADGSTGRDPDSASRGAAAPGGATGGSVGSVQGAATARPNTSFVTDVAGNHSHTNGQFTQLVAANHTGTTTGADNTDPSGSEPNIYFSAPLVAGGDHSHSVASGGDLETRPKNAYVTFIVRY